MPKLLVSFCLIKRVFISLFLKLFVPLEFLSAISKLSQSLIWYIGNLHKERDEVAQAVQEYNKIRQAVDDVVNAKETVVLETLGYFESDSGEVDDPLDSQSDCESNLLNRHFK